jgi:hypothetical protein
MKTYGRVNVWNHVFVTLTLIEGDLSASGPFRFTSGEPAHGTYCVEDGWAPESVWTTWRKENSWSYRELNSDPSVVQPVARHRTDCAAPAPGQFSGSVCSCMVLCGTRYCFTFYAVSCLMKLHLKCQTSCYHLFFILLQIIDMLLDNNTNM